MSKKYRVAMLVLLAMVVVVAAILWFSHTPSSAPSDASDSELNRSSALDDMPPGWDHRTEKNTCSVCHSPPSSHPLMRSTLCEECHAHPTWDAEHPDDEPCQSCHTLPAGHLSVSDGCASCHPEVGKSWQFIHTVNEVCTRCHEVPADHWGNDCARCHKPPQPWADARYPHVATSNCAECHTAPHRSYSGAACYSCHAGVGVSWLFGHPSVTSCAPCHEALRPAGHPTSDCVSCHNTSGWKPAKHPSATSACVACHTPPHVSYPVTCTSCHPRVGITWVPPVHTSSTNCVACHTRPSARHPNRDDCARCHSPDSPW